MCVYACVYSLCMRVCMYVYMRICMHVYVCMYSIIHVYVLGEFPGGKCPTQNGMELSYTQTVRSSLRNAQCFHNVGPRESSLPGHRRRLWGQPGMRQ